MGRVSLVEVSELGGSFLIFVDPDRKGRSSPLNYVILVDAGPPGCSLHRVTCCCLVQQWTL